MECVDMLHDRRSFHDEQVFRIIANIMILNKFQLGINSIQIDHQKNGHSELERYGTLSDISCKNSGLVDSAQ